MRFLSAEWLAGLASAMAPATGTAVTSTALTIHQRVTGGPDGDVEYTVRLDRGAVTVEPGPGPAEVEIVEDYETAAAINRGELSPAAAFASGRLRLAGSIDALVAHQDAIASVGRLLAGLAADTTY